MFPSVRLSANDTNIGLSEIQFSFSELTSFMASYDVKRSGRAMKPFSQFSLDINLLLISAGVVILIFVVVLCVAMKMSILKKFGDWRRKMDQL